MLDGVLVHMDATLGVVDGEILQDGRGWKVLDEVMVLVDGLFVQMDGTVVQVDERMGGKDYSFFRSLLQALR